MNAILKQNSKLYIATFYLVKHNVPLKRIYKWNYENLIKKVEVGGENYYLYDDIPSLTKSSIPQLEDILKQHSLEQNSMRIIYVHAQLKNVYDFGFSQHFNYYKAKYDLQDKYTLKFAKDHAVWHWIVNENDDRNLEALFTAYDMLYPKRYSSKHSFANVMKIAKQDIEKVAFDKRITNAPLNVKQITADNKFWVAELTKLGVKFGGAAIHRKLVEACEKTGTKPPSLSWVKKYHKDIKQNPLVFQSRNGNSSFLGKKQIYATITHAESSNGQWQIDGWTLPFWVKGFYRYVLVAVRDAHSKKIVGYSIAKSENTISIYNAIRDAVIDTRCLPCEIVMDNHSFNKTKEAAYLKENTEQIGVAWTVTSNPQYKSIAERYFQHLNTLCKEYTGYLGEGIKSKNENAHPNDELIQEYAKDQLTEDELKAIAVKVVYDYNKSILPKYGKTPNEMYEIGSTGVGIKMNLFDRVRLLTPKTEFTVERGQINIVRAGVKYEYQLNAEQNYFYDEKVVVVQYEDLNDCIYLYNKTTGKAIGSVPIKPKIHGAKYLQTEKDIELLNKHKGRSKGIKAKAKIEESKSIENALKINPQAIELLNDMIVSKDVVKAIQQDKDLKEFVEKQDVNINTLPIKTPQTQQINESEESEVIKTKNTPFKTVGTMRKININEFEEQ